MRGHLFGVPGAQPDPIKSASLVVTDPSCSGGTNKKQRLSGITMNEQSTTPTLTQDVNEDLPLDNKTE